MRALHRALRSRRLELPVHEVCCYPADPASVEAWAERIGEAIAAIPEQRRHSAHLLFSAHGLPRKLVDRGDPSPAHLRQTIAAVAARLETPLTHSLAFQSRAPSSELALTRLGASGSVRDLVVAPISFFAEHLETLDHALREHAGAFNDSSRRSRAWLDGLLAAASGDAAARRARLACPRTGA